MNDWWVEENNKHNEEYLKIKEKLMREYYQREQELKKRREEYDKKFDWPKVFTAEELRKEEVKKYEKKYPKEKIHLQTKNQKEMRPYGIPNSSKDKIDDKGNILTRRWYDSKGRAVKDVDFTNHGNPKQHPKVPHEHKWEWDENGVPRRGK